jgi:small subunit ribosomal protein S17
MADDETTENDDAAKAAAADAELALETIEAEAATELPAGESTEAPESAPATAPAPPATKAEEPAEEGPRPNRRKVREGIVVSDAMTSTVIVAVVERVRHPRYGKTVQRTKRLYVHDAKDSAKVGDRVRVQECRPLSKLKRWRLTEVVERAR